MRGLMLVLMTCTHLPTRFADPLGQPFGFVSAAEGFVLLSAYMAGTVYAKRALKQGVPAMRKAFLNRALTIYVCQGVLLLFLFSVIALVGLAIEQGAVKNLMLFFLNDPLTGLWGALLLLYNPPLLDILPLYVLFMLASPWLMAFGLARSWVPVLMGSLTLWFAAQFGLGEWLYDQTLARVGFPIPLKEMGSFDTFAWQFVWVLGLWMGAASVAPGPDPVPAERFPPWLVRSAVVIAIVGLVWRHAFGQIPFPDGSSFNILFDKWQVGPMRLFDLLALLIVTLHFGPAWLRWLPRVKVLERLGSASLPVFCAHLVIVLIALATIGAPSPERSVWIDLTLFVSSFVLLYGIARISSGVETKVEARAERKAAQREQTAAALSAGAPK